MGAKGIRIEEPSLNFWSYNQEMNFPHLPNLVPFVRSNSAHECGHITVLFKASRLVGLNFLPHKVAADGVKGILETDTGTQLGKEDCVALTAGMIGS
jgi:hypothetical protein